MANLRDIRDRISSVKSTQQITKAMKMVAAARLRKAQERIMSTRPFVAGLERVISKLTRSGNADNEYMNEVEKPEKVLVIVIGSDRGLCGGFNSNLFRYLSDSIEETFPGYKESGNLSLITVGRKAYEYFGKRGYHILDHNNGFFDKLSHNQTMRIMEEATELFVEGEYDTVYLGFNEFKTVLTQNRIFKKVLPVTFEASGEEDEQIQNEIDYIFEPGPDEILHDIIPLHLNMQLWRAVLESNGSEQGARMAAMDNATENAKEIIRALNLKYNQARQAAITTELSEIVSGAEALKG
jgi:F-type H+-transporting ATPase subunit gamma